MMQFPLEHYRALLASGQLQPDPAQARAAQALNALHRELEKNWVGASSLLGLIARFTRAVPKGIYIHGDVGRGKSLLMDLFFKSVRMRRKRRVHFNAFMVETHQRIHEWRQLSEHARRHRPEFVREAGDDPIAPVAKRIASEAALLCFDEFQVTDVADAMILGRLFEKLFALGVVFVITSNTAPDRLYEGGLNRELFLPFIALLKERLTIIELNGPKDYRLERIAGMKVYMTPLGATADAEMDAAWRRLTDGAKGEALTLTVLGHPLIVPEAAGGVARFSFAELCAAPLGAADYLALAHRFQTLLIDRIPLLHPEQHDEARRFTLLIDTLYDERVKLICSAAAKPLELLRDDPDADWFRRAASRLMEMQSADYLTRNSGRREVVIAT